MGKRDSVFVSHLAPAFAGKLPILTYLIDGRCDEVSQKVPLVTSSSHFVLSDLRQVAELCGTKSDLLAKT